MGNVNVQIFLLVCHVLVVFLLVQVKLVQRTSTPLFGTGEKLLGEIVINLTDVNLEKNVATVRRMKIPFSSENFLDWTNLFYGIGFSLDRKDD